MGDLVFLDTLRLGRSVPVAPYVPKQNPDEMIRMAADRSLIDRVREWVECADAVCENEPLAPRDRVTLFDSYADHPREPVFLPKFGVYSTAAGRYQLLARYFDDYRALLSLPDFSPECQDQIALRQNHGMQRAGGH
jgi:muramidase (phage lysozyme)